MKYTHNKWFVLIMFLSGSSSFAINQVPVEAFQASSGKIDFYAIGKPSMLKIHGSADSLKGTFNKNNGEVSGHFTVNMADFSSGLSLRDSHTKNKVFEVEKYPTAEITLKPFQVKTSEKNKFTGVLKFHGVEKEVQGEMTFDFSDKKAKFESSFNIQLTDFNIQPPEFAGMKINNEVRVAVSGDSVK